MFLAGTWLVLFRRRSEGTEPLLLWLGVATLVVVGLQIVKKSPTVETFTSLGNVHASLKAGVWVALAGAILICIGGLLSLAERAETQAE